MSVIKRKFLSSILPFLAFFIPSSLPISISFSIPEEAIGHVFERFYRVDKARSRATGGSGLGLAIVRTIVQRNRGEIYVSSVVGQGTTFTVVFPAFDTEVDQE